VAASAGPEAPQVEGTAPRGGPPQRRGRPAVPQEDAPAADGALGRPAEEEPRPHTPVGELDAAAVRRIWPEVLDNVKRRRRTAHALLMNVSVHSVDRGVLTLTISSVPLSRLLAQDANTDVVRAAVKDVLGVDWRINVVVDGGGADPGALPLPDEDPRDDEPTPPAADAAGGGATRVDPEEAAISLLQSTLGAKRMDG
jgi:DNA polymerase-3 subunit gamma/tau